MSLRAKAANAIRKGYPKWLVQRWLQEADQRRLAQGIPMAKRAPRMNRGGWGRQRGPSKSQMERSIGRGEKRDERRDKVAAERFARTKHPETALKHETGLLRKEHGKKADTHIDKTLKPVYERAREIKDKREARRDKRLGDAHAREVAKGEAGKKHAEWVVPFWAGMLGWPHSQPWKKGDKKPYPGWKIKGPTWKQHSEAMRESKKKWDKQWDKSQQPAGVQYDRHRTKIGTVGPTAMLPTFKPKLDRDPPGPETKKEYVARLGQRGTTPEGYSVHIPHRLHGASEEQVKKYLAYNGRNMAKEEFAWRKRTALAKWKSELRRDRMRERNKWYV